MRTCAATVLAVLLLAAGSGPAAAEDPRPGDVYVRTRRDVPETVRWLEREAERLQAAQVLLVFDAATFSPPPGVTEFTLQYGFFQDLPLWVEALRPWAERAEISLRATSSLAPKSIDLRQGGWETPLRELVERRWWEGDRIAELEIAPRWMRRLLERTEAGVPRGSARRERMLVLVTGGFTPERWIPTDQTMGFESEWRTKLRPVGEYWDEQTIGTLLQREGCRFYAVAPEARFCDIAPLPEIPELPWAARPQFPPDDVLGLVGDVRSGLVPGFGPAMRRMLDQSLRAAIPDPEERRARVDEMLRDMRRRSADTVTPGGGPGGTPGLVVPYRSPLRFISSTPLWFPMLGRVVPLNNHAPSGYGVWPLARVAAKTGGRYVFYPFPATRWLDECPADPALLDRLAPELVNRTRFVGLRKGDRAADALGRAAAHVVDVTPWADHLPFERGAQAWTAFSRTRPLRLEGDVQLRRKPFDQPLTDDQQDVELMGKRIAEHVLPRYDEAIEILDEALAAIRDARDDSSHPRSVANLRLARYWFAMSAFHLHAYSIYAQEVERFVPESMKGHVDHIAITYVTTIRMSDCLPAYDGRTLTLADEAAYERWTPERAPGYQGNVLTVPAGDPNYRAKRALASVLRYLDPRLRRRAEDMVRAAGNVMRGLARTSWGWTTYYSEAFTFVFHPVEVPRGHRPTRGGGKPRPAPTTPRGPGSSGGGSSPGGPSTGG